MNRDTSPWNIEDLIDLEFFIHMDESLPDGPLKNERQQKDRAFYLEDLHATAGEKPLSRRAVLRRWLDFRRASAKDPQHGGPILPGDVFKQIYTIMILVMVFTGLFSGAGLCFSFLVYKGHAPLNISSYLGIFVLSQMVLVLGFVFWLLLFRFKGPRQAPSLIRMALGQAIIRLAAWVMNKATRRITAAHRNSTAAALGIVRGKSRAYGEVFPWPLIILTQVFAVCFNLGVLAATLLRVIGSDLAFGWQSTLQLSTNAAHRIVVLLSLPWNGWIPEHLAHPTLAQVEGSRIILKDGLTRLATPDLTAWWPFLCFAVLFYGLLPRLVFLVTALFMRARSLKHVSFERVAFDKVLLTLSSPSLETRGEIQPGHTPPEHTLTQTKIPAIQGLDRPVYVLVPDDILTGDLPAGLEPHINDLFKAPLGRTLGVCLDPGLDRERLKGAMTDSGGRLALLMESFQPPIRETLHYIREVKALGGPHFRLYVLLTGKPGHGGSLTRPTETELTVWKKSIQALGDPDIHVEQLF